MRDITVGETLTFDYAMADGSEYDEFTCACGSTSCRGRVTGTDWQRTDLQQRHAGYCSPYLVRRMQAARTAKPLSKRDVETLMNTLDSDPIAALTVALRRVLGRPHSSFETLVELSPVDGPWRDGLIAGHAAALDRLASHLNEFRGL